jgi:uncharacterized protein YecT (DUF1311 family)
MRALLLLLLAVAALVTHAEDIPPGSIAWEAAPAVFTLVCFDNQDKPIGTGTGFTIDETGTLVTNAHVIENAKRILVRRDKFSFFEVERVLAVDPLVDLALLKVRCERIAYLKLENSIYVGQGDRVLVYDSPLGLEGTLSEGIVSAVRREGSDEILQIPAAISPGSSGSPVFNTKGQVVGIAVARIEGGQSLNFAIPSSSLKSLFEAAGRKKFSRQLDLFDLRPRKGETQAEMNEDAFTTFKKTEEEMTALYQNIMQRYSGGKGANPALVERLRAAQRAWITFRDAQLEAILPSDGGHFSAGPMCAALLRTELTRHRIEQLNEWWDGITEGDVCCGTRAIRQ